MRLVLAVLACLFAMSAFAQGQPPTTIDQRVATQIGTLVIQNASQAVQIEALQTALAAAQVQVKQLQDKYEPQAGPSKP